MDEWTIRGPSGCCCGTGNKIEPGQEYYAALVETEEGLQRRDYCVEYWRQHRPQVYCFWKTRMARQIPKGPRLVDDQLLEAFFDRLAGETSPERVAFRFVLALILMRRRRLRYEGTLAVDGRQVWRLRWAGHQEMVDVLDPQLDQEQIQEVSRQLGQVLNADL